jgi:hypothetical protein
MAILSPTNKKKGKAFIFFFGLVLFVTMLIRVFRTKVDKPSDYISVAKDEIKSLTSLS